MFRVFKSLVRNFPDSMLLIAGDGPLENELKEQVRYLGLEQHIFLLGHRKAQSAMGVKARQRVLGYFTMDRMTAKIISVY